MNIAKRIVAGLFVAVTFLVQIPFLLSLWMMLGSRGYVIELWLPLIPLVLVGIATELFGISAVIGKNIAVYVGAALSGLLFLSCTAVTVISIIGIKYLPYLNGTDYLAISLTAIVMLVMVVAARILQKFNKNKIAYILSLVMIGLNALIGFIVIMWNGISSLRFVMGSKGRFFPRYFGQRLKALGFMTTLFGNVNFLVAYKIIASLGILLSVTLIAVIAVIADKKKKVALSEEAE